MGFVVEKYYYRAKIQSNVNYPTQGVIPNFRLGVRCSAWG